jgi:two-component system chemotaxis response regulator CheY
MKKVLIVDDSATMRRIVMRVLRQAEVHFDEALEAGDGIEGLKCLIAHPDVALILSDVNMPGMNGIEFLKAVRSKFAMDKLPVVMITTEASDEAIAQATALGANRYITKPFTPERVQQSLAGLVA